MTVDEINSALCTIRCIPKGKLPALVTYLIGQWANNLTPTPPANPPFIAWTPTDQVLQWVDGSGTHNGDYPTFLATADLTTITDIIDFDPDTYRIVTFIARYVTSLQYVTLQEGFALTSCEVTGCTGIVNLFINNSYTLNSLIGLTDCHSLLSFDCSNHLLTSIDFSGSPLVTTIFCGNGSVLTNANIFSSPAIVNFLTGSSKFTTAQVNAFLIYLDSTGNVNGNCDLSNMNPPAPPSGAGAAAKASLILKSWIVTTD